MDECKKRGIRVALEICDKSFEGASNIDCQIAVTASSGINRKIFPTKARWLIHMPHSLSSLHMIYPSGSFHGYDLLFSCGPHHDREFYELTGRDTCPVGYGKLDLLAKGSLTSDPCDVLIAPSWGSGNLIERFGSSLVKHFEELNLEVVLRPHPLFFLESSSPSIFFE